MVDQQKIIESLKLPFNRKSCNHLKKLNVYQNFLETKKNKYNCQGTAFVFQSSRCVSKEQACLKTTGLYDDVFSILYSVFSFHLVSVFWFLCLFFNVVVLSQAFCVCVCMCIYMCIYICINSVYNIYFGKFMDFAYLKYLWHFDSTCLTQYE